MSVSLVDVVRINNQTYAWSSLAFTVDGMATEGIVAVDYEDSLELRVIPSNVQDTLPLGMSLGRYQVGRFPLRMLRDSALALKNYLTTKAPAAQSGSYGQATFTLGLQLSAVDAPSGGVGSTTVFANCRIVGERAVHEEGIAAAITEFSVACLAIVQDSNSLFDATGQASALLPGTDTITIAGLPAPGKWTLLRGPKVYGWDIRKGYGLAGATVVPTGDDLVSARFLVEIWDPADYALFQVFRSTYLKKQLVSVAGAPVGLAIGIDHPELKALGATAFVPKEINPLVNDGFGVWGAEIEFLQFRPAQPALGKPDASIPDAGAPTPTAQTQTEVEIDQQLAQLQALSGG
jgi:hypothetical protein